MMSDPESIMRSQSYNNGGNQNQNFQDQGEPYEDQRQRS